MYQHSNPARSTMRGRRVAAVVAVAFATVALTATTASAQSACRSQVGSVNCFSIDPVGNGDYKVHLGIDVDMSRADAQTFIDHPGEEFSAKLYGDDPVWDNALKNVPVTWSAAWDGGLSAEFDVVLDRRVLDEDSDGRDELYSLIRLWDPRTNTTRTFTTNVLTGSY
jgi:hypothetical protein